MSTHTENTKTYSKLKNPKKLRFGIDKPKANTANHVRTTVPGDNYLFPTSSQLSFLSHWTFWAWLYLLQGIHAVGGTERVRAGERLQRGAPEDVCRKREDCRVQAEDTVSERLRRWTRNPLGSARRGSNPLGVDCRGGEKQRKIVGG